MEPTENSIDGETLESPLLNRIIFVLSLFGILVAGYLWFLHATHGDIPCGGSNDCEVVASSSYAHFPVGNGPWVASYGTFGYLVLIVLSFMRTLPGDWRRDRLLLAGIVLAAGAGTAFSLWLTWIELNIIHAKCKWCLTSQGIILAIFLISLAELVRRYLSRANREPLPQGTV